MPAGALRARPGAPSVGVRSRGSGLWVGSVWCSSGLVVFSSGVGWQCGGMIGSMRERQTYSTDEKSLLLKLWFAFRRLGGSTKRFFVDLVRIPRSTFAGWLRVARSILQPWKSFFVHSLKFFLIICTVIGGWEGCCAIRDALSQGLSDVRDVSPVLVAANEDCILSRIDIVRSESVVTVDIEVENETGGASFLSDSTGSIGIQSGSGWIRFRPKVTWGSVESGSDIVVDTEGVSRPFGELTLSMY